MRGANSNPLETISAAATAIASAGNRVPQASVQKRRWGSCWSIYSCFGFHNQSKRIGHAVLVSEATAPGTAVPAAEIPTQTPAIELPFVAPPSSPASFLQSEPPSCTQSPAGIVSHTSISASMYSPGPAAIFAIGPYAHETQLISPPVFYTEPSTAPFTPPPESVQLTTPPSPEVPFAQFLDPNHQSGDAGQRFHLSQYQFQAYQLYPGSAVGHLISPSSGISGSGTSSPFPDCEFRIGDPPLLLNLDKLSSREWESQQGSGSLTPDPTPRSRDSSLLDRQNSDIAPLANPCNGCRYAEAVVDYRVSFEITSEDVRCMAKEPSLAKVVSSSVENAQTAAKNDEKLTTANSCGAHIGKVSDETSDNGYAGREDEQWPQKHRSPTLGSVKEFNFDNADEGNSDEPMIGSDLLANEKIIEEEGRSSKNWSFFPVRQPGVS
ncbi:hypothetical protein CEY00_Acc20027 [Actinidia chinensis var. chinensis]|uniref:Hydroxyproline-rich glycoprotein family protein n=1 Tax=Actinidia chinensis var. chinensis TaxID=1590841 RepID=A0A2R6Q8F4_ACTCC|nr:hypothetical protein CEY00_Acc20027 [Actinidia chinensis var. chinensis]